MPKTKWDFSGYATRNDLKCSDGRVIRHGAFKDCDGATVPLVWQHRHDSPDNVIGHAVLENRDDGVYAYCSCNDSKYGDQARELVRHGDISSLSIYANHLKQHGSDVVHGTIREVSLVLAGANPGAFIDNIAFSHSDGSYDISEEDAIIYSDSDVLMHGDDDTDEDEETVEDVFNAMTDKQKNAVYAIVEAVMDDRQAEEPQKGEGKEMKHADENAPESSEKTVEEVFNTLTDEQKNAVYAMIGAIAEEYGIDVNEEKVEHSEGDNMAKHNIFEDTEETGMQLSHSDVEAIFADAKRMGSLKDAVLEHGITGISNFFPEDQLAVNQPGLISRNMEWVDAVLNGVHKSPFSRVKSVYANITADEARAKGYIKGTKKVEEQIAALKRNVSPTTIYKLQKLDRDDIVDITDFDVVAWIKQEMRTMLNEEVARAILVGDGRSNLSNDKIDESKIIPIWTDDEVYTIHKAVAPGQDRAKAFIEAAIRARKEYKGSGAPTLFVGPTLLTDMRLIRDTLGYRIYKNDQELADELRVSKIVEVEVLDSLTRTDTTLGTLTFGGIIVNLADYNVGATKGGEVTLFDDFDLNYNKYEYLIETRMSGALIQPKAAIALEFTAAETEDETEGETESEPGTE